MGDVLRSTRILAGAGIAVSLLLVAAVVVSIWSVRRPFPQTTGTVQAPGLTAPVMVVRDEHGIPQLYADTAEDLFYAQGFVQAQDRFFEMDFRRHLTAGRLAEMFGDDALDTDMMVRTMGWRRVAEQELGLLTTESRSYLEAFADGVNAYIADRSPADLSLEYTMLDLGGLDYTPEKWTPTDSLAWLKAMSWNLGSNLADEVERALDVGHLDADQVDDLFPSYPYGRNKPIVNQGAVVDGVYEQDAKKPGTRLPSRPPFVAARGALESARDAISATSDLLPRGDGLGSNAWVVSGEHTASGAPILANDPHLEASMPSVWYQMGLHCNRVGPDCPFDVSGFTFAGLPGVVIGHNQRIAWGFTNMYPDVQDLYLEKVLPGNRYVYNGEPRRLTTHEETFEVAGGDDVTITVRSSRHGPLISDVESDYATVGANAPVPPVSPDRGNGYAVALRWTALQPGRTADALFAIDRARTWQEFRAAAARFDSPSQNMVYADVDGHIGYQAPGRIPIRRSGSGRWPVPGWNPAYEWSPDDVPFQALPTLLDPKSGIIVTANQPVTGPEYTYYLGDSYDLGYRAQRIRTLLQGRSDLTVDDLAQIQLDDYSVLGKRLTPLLLSVRLPTPYYRQGQEVLRDWDFRTDVDSAGAAYFNAVWRNLLDLTFHDELPDSTWPDGGDRWWRVILGLADQPTSRWWDDQNTPEVVETRDDIVRTAMIAARDDLTSILSRHPEDWRWGQIHRLTLRNATLGAEGSPVGFLFNRGPYEVAGGSSIVNATSWDASEGYDAVAVPSMRMVVPLDDFDAARWINLTGASGHAFSSHYTDQTELWRAGETLPWPYTPEAVDRAGDEQLVLEPART